LFENSRLSAKRFDVVENADNVRIVTGLLKTGSVNLNELVHMSYQAFYAGNEETRRAHYAEAWALIYYLRKAELPGKPFPYAGLNSAYADAAVKLRDADKATRRAFANIHPAQLQADFSAFWQSPHKRAQARRNRIFKSFNAE